MPKLRVHDVHDVGRRLRRRPRPEPREPASVSRRDASPLGVRRVDRDEGSTSRSCDVGGWSSEEIATITGTTSGAVRVRLHRVGRQLREALEENDG